MTCGPRERARMANGEGMIAFWLRPAAREAEALQQIIHALAERHDAPFFQPHVTLNAGHMTEARALEILRASAARAPIRFAVDRLDYSDEFTKTLFVQFAETTEGRALSDALARAMGGSDYSFDPHLSLIYQKMRRAEKEALSKSVRLPFSEVTCDALVAVACPRTIETRADVEAWRVIGEEPLALG